MLVVGGISMPVESKPLTHLRQIASMRPADSLKVMPLPEGQKPVPAIESPAPRVEGAVSQPGDSLSMEFSGTSYDPSGRRDPFLPMVQLGQQVEQDASLPPAACRPHRAEFDWCVVGELRVHGHGSNAGWQGIQHPSRNTNRA